MLRHFDLSDFRRSVWPRLSALGFAYHFAFASETWLVNHGRPAIRPEMAWPIRLAICLLLEARERGHVCIPLSACAALLNEREYETATVNLDIPGMVSIVEFPAEKIARLLVESGVAALEALREPSDSTGNTATTVARTTEPPMESAPPALLIRHDNEDWWLYLAADAEAETALASQLVSMNVEGAGSTTGAELASWFGSLPAAPAPSAEQQEAVFTALSSRLFVLSGGPGTGKTSTVFHILRALYRQFVSGAGTMPTIALAAPTGRAAARMRESLAVTSERLAEWLNDPTDLHFVEMLGHLDGATLHRLLGISGRFIHERPHSQLPFEIIVVDEASMVDLQLMQKLVSRIGPQTHLVLVGDHNQLPSVESGAVLAELIAASTGNENGAGPRIAAARLTTFFRSRRGILDCSLAVLHGNTPALESSDVSVVRLGTPTTRPQLIDKLLSSWIQQNGLAEICRECAQLQPENKDETLAGLFHTAHAQVILSPFHATSTGVEILNLTLCEKLRSGLSRTTDTAGVWFPGMLVMASRNDYERGLFNGDRGIVYRDRATLRVWFPRTDGSVRVDPTPASIPGLQPAFAMTIHKSQGSEFDTVLLFVGESGSKEGHICRELLYTGMTRARNHLSLAIDNEAFQKACSLSARRWTRLADRMNTGAPVNRPSR